MEKKLNSGAFFKNDKGDNPNRPDYKGTYTDANGNDHWASAWVKKDKNGNTYLSFTTQVKEAKVEAPTVSASVSDDDSGLPF
jgi:uncharacterized protein (DUF736 family)